MATITQKITEQFDIKTDAGQVVTVYVWASTRTTTYASGPPSSSVFDIAWRLADGSIVGPMPDGGYVMMGKLGMVQAKAVDGVTSQERAAR